MTNSSPPEQRPPRRREDEAIAVVVTFLTFAAIFGWSISQGQWVLPGFVSGIFVPSPLDTEASPPPDDPTVAPPPDPTAEASPVPEATRPGEPVPSPQTAPEVGIVPYIPVIPRPEKAAEPQIVAPAPTVAPVVPVPVPPATPSPGARTASPSPIPTPLGSPISFADVSKDYWAYPFITALSARGIIGGFPDGTFRPTQPVTRGQFAVQLQKAFTKPDQLPPKQFTDVSPDSLWAVAVDKAVKGNFMSGYPDGTFQTEQQVSRVEAVTAIARGLGLPEPTDPEAVLQGYVDQNRVPNWARAKVAAAIQAGLFSGDPDTRELNPLQPATRADIAALIYQALERSIPNRDRVSNRSSTNNDQKL